MANSLSTSNCTTPVDEKHQANKTYVRRTKLNLRIKSCNHTGYSDQGDGEIYSK